MKILITLLAALVIATVPGESQAQEVPEPKMMMVNTGMLCDTKDDLETLLTGIHLSNGKFPEVMPETCGRFVPEQPIPMFVTPLEWYETPSVLVLTAHFVYLSNGWSQFGWVAYIPNPDYVPTSGDPT